MNNIRAMANDSSPHGFTLIEMMVVLLLMAVLASVGLARYNTTMEQTIEGQMVQSLRAIHAANETYNSKAHSYWPPDSNGGGGYDLNTINAELGLALVDQGAGFSCASSDGGASYSCTAARTTGEYSLLLTSMPLSGTNPCCLAGNCPTVPQC